MTAILSMLQLYIAFKNFYYKITTSIKEYHSEKIVFDDVYFSKNNPDMKKII